MRHAEYRHRAAAIPRARPLSLRSVNGPLELARLLGRRPDLKPFTLTANAVINTTVNPSEVDVEMQVPADSDFHAIAATLAFFDSSTPDVEGFTGQPHLTPAYWWAHADIKEDRGGKRLSNIPVSVGSIFGSGREPFVYPVPWELKAGTRVDVEIYNQSTIGPSDGRFFIAWHGVKKHAGSARLPMPLLMEPRLLPLLSRYARGGRLLEVDPFFYSLFTGHDQLGSSTRFTPLATESPTFTVSGHDFACCWLTAEFFEQTGAAFLQGAALGRANVMVELVLDEGRTKLSSRPLHVETIFGHGTHWMRLPEPLLIREGQSLTAVVTPQQLTGTAAPNDRWIGHLTFAGARLYNRGAR